MTYQRLRNVVLEYYDAHSRELPWRQANLDGTFSLYDILVSEFMLQQTQVQRVVPKFEQFIANLPTMETLASASLSQVLELWSGLGYNRRAKYLHEAAKTLVQHSSINTIDQLIACKGIGSNTAKAILTYTYNQRHIFIETNIRTVLFHHLYVESDKVTDSQLASNMETLVPKSDFDYRTFYWALMDYGTYLKRSGIRNTSQAKRYQKQSRFDGSHRQIRGKIIKYLTGVDGRSIAELSAHINDERLTDILITLQGEGLVNIEGSYVSLP